MLLLICFSFPSFELAKRFYLNAGCNFEFYSLDEILNQAGHEHRKRVLSSLKRVNIQTIIKFELGDVNDFNRIFPIIDEDLKKRVSLFNWSN